MMEDRDRAIDSILKFLEDETKKILLVRGYDHNAKARVVLSCLNAMFDRGIIRTNSMSNISYRIHQAFDFKKKFLPDAVKSTISYKIGDMTIRINSYGSNTKVDLKGNENTFTLYFPVQLVLQNQKDYSNFLNDIKNCNSRKIILITTNEWGIKDWDIEMHVDEVFFYDVEHDNPQLMSNLRNNGAI